MAINLLRLEYPQRFEEFCKDLLAAEIPGFESFSGTDRGIDGYHPGSETIFQFYFPERTPEKRKVKEDLEKAVKGPWPCRRWVLLLPKDPPLKLKQWLEDQQEHYHFEILVWGRTQLLRILRANPSVKESYFPSEVRQTLRRLARGKRPRPGDAAPGMEISEDQKQELRQWIEALAEQEAKRRRRKPKERDYKREYGEFNSKHEISEFSKLPAVKFGFAIEDLQKKFYARRGGEPKRVTSQRRRDGIHAIKNKLRMTNAEYKEHLLRLTGKDSTRQMGSEELESVFRNFRRMQQEAEAESQ